MGSADEITPPPTVSIQKHPTASGVSRIVLHGRVTISQTAELHETATALAAGTDTIEVDCTRVTHMDAAVMQVILALGRAVEGDGRRCVVTAGEAVRLFRQAGLAAIVSG